MLEKYNGFTRMSNTPVKRKLTGRIFVKIYDQTINKLTWKKLTINQIKKIMFGPEEKNGLVWIHLLYPEKEKGFEDLKQVDFLLWGDKFNRFLEKFDLTKADYVMLTRTSTTKEVFNLYIPMECMNSDYYTLLRMTDLKYVKSIIESEMKLYG